MVLRGHQAVNIFLGTCTGCMGILTDGPDLPLFRLRIMDEMRQVLQEGQVEQRVQYLVEGLFKTQRDGFEKSGHPQIPSGLDLVEDAEKFEVVFDINEDVPDVQLSLNIFKFDEEYEQREKEYEVRLPAPQ